MSTEGQKLKNDEELPSFKKQVPLETPWTIWLDQ